jgi:hypothetical protein
LNPTRHGQARKLGRGALSMEHESMRTLDEQKFAVRCAMRGFNLELWDAWFATLDPCDARTELAEHRAQSKDALSRGDHARADLHLECMRLQRFGIVREDFLLPLAAHEHKRLTGSRKPRRPKINAWILTQLAYDPDAKSPDLWRRAPSWITDQIGQRRFANRVTDCRKIRASK